MAFYVFFFFLFLSFRFCPYRPPPISTPSRLEKKNVVEGRQQLRTFVLEVSTRERLQCRQRLKRRRRRGPDIVYVVVGDGQRGELGHAVAIRARDGAGMVQVDEVGLTYPRHK